jgi:hypothetical protein
MTDLVSEMTIDSKLAAELNPRFPPEAEASDKIEKACCETFADGWMCADSDAGRRWGRVKVAYVPLFYFVLFFPFSFNSYLNTTIPSSSLHGVIAGDWICGPSTKNFNFF